MKVKFCLDSGANINSCRSETFDTVKDLGLEEDEWELLPVECKNDMVWEWANNHIEMWYEELS